MKLSFSTRGRRDVSWDEQLFLAKDSRYNGIEIYDITRTTSLTNASGPFNKFNVFATARNLREMNLEIPCMDSSLDLSLDEDLSDKIKENIDIAAFAGCPYVSIRADYDKENLIHKRIKNIISYAEKSGIIILIKTCGIYSDSKKLADFLDTYASDNLAALWDIHHTYRDAAETPETTIKNLGAYIKHVHLRDSTSKDNFKLIGEGNIPVEEMIESLNSVDYDGFISFVWKPNWMNEFKDMDVILPYFANYMNKFQDTRGKKKLLYPTSYGKGRYVWKRDSLLNLTFSQVLDRMAEEFPNQYAFKYTTLDYTRTYEEFREDVDNFARALISIGVKPGDKVAVWATNIPAWYIAFWSVVKIGAVLVSVNTAYKIHEIEYLLRQSDTHTLITIEGGLNNSYKDTLLELCPELKNKKPEDALHSKRLPFLRNIITADFKMEGCLTFDEVMKRSNLVSKKKMLSLAEKVKPDDVCNMQYTSGTTGFPKGVMLTQYNVVNDGKCIGDRMELSTADRMMIQVPMFHCFGMVLAMTASMTHGTTLCPLPYFSAKSALACINQERITCFHGVPTMFIAMFNHEDYRKTDFSYMRTGIMAGAGCPADLMRKAARPDEMNMRGIVSVYGQTESAPGSTMSAWDDPIDIRVETVGYAFPHVECKVIDPETGEIVPNGENGEFCSRGYNTMKGYYKMPTATKDAIDKDGWLHSGDLAMKDENDCYHITGRLKDMIIRGGENIYPKEIEEFFYTHPEVQDVQVIGIPDKKYGEEVMAEIILKSDSKLTEDDLRTYAQGKMARHKVPRYIEIVNEFPMNAAGKVLKYKMREDAVKRLGL